MKNPAELRVASVTYAASNPMQGLNNNTEFLNFWQLVITA
jgi:hypothetical protein